VRWGSVLSVVRGLQFDRWDVSAVPVQALHSVPARSARCNSPASGPPMAGVLVSQRRTDHWPAAQGPLALPCSSIRVLN
jgi:hypothetical protein